MKDEFSIILHPSSFRLEIAMAAFWHQLRHLFSGSQLPWTILLVGLAALIVGLIVLTRTNWGQSHPLHKCAALSLLVHLLLAAYATTVEIVTAGTPDGNSDRGRVAISLVSEPSQVTDDAATPKKNPWDQLLVGTPDVPEAMKLERREPLPNEIAPAAPTADPVAIAKPVLDKLLAIPSSLEKPAAVPAAAAPKTDTPVTAPVAKPAPPQPSAIAPDRLSTTEKSPADADAASVVPGQPRTTAAGQSADSLPLDPSTGNSPNAKTVAASPVAPATIDAGELKTAASAKSAAQGGSKNQSTLVMVPVAGSHSNTGDSGSANTSTSSGANSGGDSREPEVYRDRTAGDRGAILRRRGGSPETEAAVQAALKWLAAVQSPDGHWDADRFGAGRETMTLGQNRSNAGAKADTAMTGLALLALLGSGNTHRDGPYADNVRRGLNFLLSVQGADGNLGGQTAASTFMYAHGIASVAMSEDYAMTHDKRLEKPLRSAINYTIACQHPTTGGWRYYPHETGDTSQLGWQLMALKSADLAGIAMPQTTRAGATRFLKSVASGPNSGLAAYRPNEVPSRAMTAEALVCRQFLGTAGSRAATLEAGDYLLGELPSRERVNLYYWYYGTLAMYQLGGDHWQRWNAALQAALLDEQRSDGDLAGSWDPKCIWGGYGGRIYSTSMSALCLEVYYRFLPLYGGDTDDAKP